VVEVGALLRRAASLETRVPVILEEAPALTIQGDSDQLEQALINLVRNAADASTETGGRVFLRTERTAHAVDLIVRDEGPGLSNTKNLFVPFFTTKRGGTGIGLVLTRQIAEAHNGSVTLRNVPDGPGCEAILTLPIHL
jgi:signal transduction histidine kinase